MDFSIPAGADAQAVKTAIREAAANLTIYIAGEVQDDGSLLIYADEALEIREATTADTSKTLDDPGTNPSVSVSWPNGEELLTLTNITARINERIYNLELSDDGTTVSTEEGSNYTEEHPLYYVSDSQTTPIRLYDGDSVLLSDNPTWTFSLDPFLMAQHDSPIQPYFGSIISGGDERYVAIQIAGVKTILGSDSFLLGTWGTPVLFSSAELTDISAGAATLTVQQTATGIRSSATISAGADAQAIADAIAKAAAPFTVYIDSSIADDGTLSVYADEEIVVEYTIDPTASITPLQSQGVLVYPNPVRTHLYLDYPSATPATYTIYGLTGKRHSSHHASGQTHRIDVSSLAKGVYLLKAEHGSQTGVFRFVKE